MIIMGRPFEDPYDVVIVGAGIAGALIAKHLGAANRRVLVIEAGAPLLPNINDEMHRFYNAAAKVPESPYTPDIVDPEGHLIDPANVKAGRPTVLSLSKGAWQNPSQSYLIQKGPLPFGSTYERIAGGTARHWLGTSLRHVPHDFKMRSTYGGADDWPPGLVDWPIDYETLNGWYGKAEEEIGVSGDKTEQAYLGIHFPSDHKYPMPKIPQSVVDKAFAAHVDKVTVDGIHLSVTSTPAARNSQPFGRRRVCAGNTNCIPICPIQAKYDPTITLRDALNTGNVTILFQAVARDVVTGAAERVTRIDFTTYPDGADHGVRAKAFVIAANAIETPRLLLMSGKSDGVANRSGTVGRHLMDHPYYVAWALMPDSSEGHVWPYRGPLATSGIESARDGEFRRTRAAFRVDIGNEGWGLPVQDPATTTLDFIAGLNNSGTNKHGKDGQAESLFGRKLVARLNSILTRQVRLGFLIEQTPEASNRVTLAKEKDGLGLPRPQIEYDFSSYTKWGLAKARETASAIFTVLGAEEYTRFQDDDPCSFEWPIGSGKRIKYYGAGHIVGTCRMGTNSGNSVVDHELRSWDHKNLFIAGSSVFPTVATANPTLTIAALSMRLAETIRADRDLA
jgi:choline dehydrogenase-like flavoprotein